MANHSGIMLASAALYLLNFLPNMSASVAAASTMKPIMIDTDIYSDVDDVGALTVANALHNCGLADLRGVCVNTPSKYGGLAVSVSMRDAGVRGGQMLSNEYR